MLQWWEWERADKTLKDWIRALIGERSYTIRFGPDEGSFVNFTTRQIVVDPLAPRQWGGLSLLPRRWRGWRLTRLDQLEWHCARALARHEAAHILYTNPVLTCGETHGWLVNALE